MMRAMLMSIVLVSSALPVVAAAPEQDRGVFNGTIQTMDVEHRTLTVKNELGRHVVLEVANPVLLQDLSPGDQVSIEMERPGRAKKITKLAVPELRGPLPPVP